MKTTNVAETTQRKEEEGDKYPKAKKRQALNKCAGNQNKTNYSEPKSKCSSSISGGGMPDPSVASPSGG